VSVVPIPSLIVVILALEERQPDHALVPQQHQDRAQRQRQRRQVSCRLIVAHGEVYEDAEHDQDGQDAEPSLDGVVPSSPPVGSLHRISRRRGRRRGLGLGQWPDQGLDGGLFGSLALTLRLGSGFV